MFHPQGPTLAELIRQGLSSTERGYDLLAPKFDYTPFRTPDSILQAAARQIGGTGSVGSALDLCCGTGAGLRAVLPLCREHGVGIDFSRGMLEVARRSGERAGPARVDWVQGDVLRLPFAGAFDLAVCFGAHGHILARDERLFVSQVARALSPGGRFVFATTRRPPFFSLQHWLARGFNAALRVRNLLIRPRFVMYYLTFLLPEVERLLETEGFDVEVREGVFDPPFNSLALVIATKRSPSRAAQRPSRRRAAPWSS